MRENMYARQLSKSGFCLVVCAMLAMIMHATTVVAQTENALYTFTGGTDGAVPQGNLIADANGNYYGANVLGGQFGGNCFSFGCGNVFELSPNGSGGWTETVLYTFTGGSDGAGPEAGLAFDSHGNLFGTTVDGGYLGNSDCGLIGPGCGVVFELSPNGDGTWTESVVYTFRGGQDGFLPQTAVGFDASGNLYGTADLGGSKQVGTIFELSPNGSGGWTYNRIHSFTNGKDGGRPVAGFLVDSKGDLFVTTTQGGNLKAGCKASGCGALFEMSPNGSGGWIPHVLHDFTGHQDGAIPVGISMDANGNLFGVAQNGGNDTLCTNLGEFPGCGVVYEVMATSGGWKGQVIYTFTGQADGANPDAALAFDATGNVYGTSNKGYANSGAVFKLSQTAGIWTEQTLYGFTGGLDGGEPDQNGVILDGSGNVFGTTQEGGDAACTINGPPGCGVFYEIKP